MLDKKKGHLLRHLHPALYILGFLLLLALIVPRIDIWINDFFSFMQNPFILTIAKGISYLGGAEIIIGLSIILLAYLIYKKRKSEIKFYLTSIIGGTFLVYILKMIIGRERPSGLIGSYMGDFSFPSGHAFSSLIAYGAIALILRYKNEKLSDWIFVIPLLVGISRIMLGVHWFSDVIASFFLGLVWLYACARIFLLKEKG